MMAAASAAAITGVCAVASAQTVPLELEGPFSAYEVVSPESGWATIMGQNVFVDENTAFVTPTSDKTQTQRPNNANRPLNANQWIRGERFEGRRRPGFLNGTLIVTGFWDPDMPNKDGTGLGAIYAEEVFSDIAENVILGVITDSFCTEINCNGEGNYIEGNGSTKFLDNKDQRLPAGPVVDAGLFEVDLSGNPDLTGVLFGGEGYYTDDPVHPRGSEEPDEQALIYWDFSLGDFQPNLLLNASVAEISVLRIRCEAGDRLEVRGWVHQPIGSGLSPATGQIRATLMRPGQPNVVATNGTPAAIDVTAPEYGFYQLRQDVPACGDEVLVEWVAGNGTILASTVAGVDRLREDGDDD